MYAITIVYRSDYNKKTERETKRCKGVSIENKKSVIKM